MAWDHELSSHERGYGHEWRKLRQQALRRDGYLCQPCYRKGRPTPATQVDHITPKAKDGGDDLNNLQSICGPCHKAKTQAEATGDKRLKFDEKGNPIW